MVKYRALLPEELESTDQQTLQEAFEVSVSIMCAPGATVEDINKLGDVETPMCDLYEDDSTECESSRAPPEELV